MTGQMYLANAVLLYSEGNKRKVCICNSHLFMDFCQTFLIHFSLMCVIYIQYVVDNAYS